VILHSRSEIALEPVRRPTAEPSTVGVVKVQRGSWAAVGNAPGSVGRGGTGNGQNTSTLFSSSMTQA
jgi:hypothetical protein